MRLWHIDLIPYLPKSQLLAQWRELNSIFKKQDKHILINYIYDYSDHYLFDYTCAVLNELGKRNIKTNTSNCYCYFYLFGDYGTIKIKNKYDYKFKEHNDEYLTICYWNLREKYLRGQKDFTKEIWDKLDNFIKMKFNQEKKVLKEALKSACSYIADEWDGTNFGKQAKKLGGYENYFIEQAKENMK